MPNPRIFIRFFFLLPFSIALADSNPVTQLIEYEDDDEYYDDSDSFPVWAGPGWYAGVYINNEDEYQNHYNEHHSHQHGREDRREQRPAGRGGHEGGGRGGGHR